MLSVYIYIYTQIFTISIKTYDHNNPMIHHIFTIDPYNTPMMSLSNLAASARSGPGCVEGRGRPGAADADWADHSALRGSGQSAKWDFNGVLLDFNGIFVGFYGIYPLVIQHSYGKSPCVVGKLTINSPFSRATFNYWRVAVETHHF